MTGLTGGQAYTFTVIATNARGDSAASTPSAPFTPEAAPSDGGGGGGGSLPPPEEPVEEGPITEADGSLPSQDPGTSTLLIDGEPASASVTDTDTSMAVSGSGFTMSLSPLTSTGESPPTVSDGSVDDTVGIPSTVPAGDHTVQIAGMLVDGRSIAFNLGVEVVRLRVDDLDERIETMQRAREELASLIERAPRPSPTTPATAS